MRFLLFSLLTCVSLTVSAAPVALTESTFTEIVNDVNVVAAATKTATRAQTNQLFKAPDLVRTGPASRVELTASDKTITRIGANTIFSFEPSGRSIYLEKGSILFHAPAGQGGGSIKHGGATAAVLGTTIVCSILLDGAFKTLVLEGECVVTLRNGDAVTLHAGQMIIIAADGESHSEVMNFNIQQLIAHMLLIQGFSNPLSSMPLITDAIQQQLGDIASGAAGPFTIQLVVGQGLDIFGTNPSDFHLEVPSFINFTGQPMSPTIPSP
ncbi:MAG: hypothetical protein QOD03_96 [Verrucomicrobiota bacterium]|jgi:hypothetical protein